LPACTLRRTAAGQQRGNSKICCVGA
jgi:hypothetical protein